VRCYQNLNLKCKTLLSKSEVALRMYPTSQTNHHLLK
jgi:hypothetical protein